MNTPKEVGENDMRQTLSLLYLSKGKRSIRGVNKREGDLLKISMMFCFKCVNVRKRNFGMISSELDIHICKKIKPAQEDMKKTNRHFLVRSHFLLPYSRYFLSLFSPVSRFSWGSGDLLPNP